LATGGPRRGSTEIIRFSSFVLLGGLRGIRVSGGPDRAKTKYRRFTGGKATQLQCNALRGQEKSRRRKNRGKQAEKQEKTGCRTMETGGNTGSVTTSGCNAGRHATALRASRYRWTELLVEFVDEPGRNSHTPICAISTNGERAQQRNDTTKSRDRMRSRAQRRRRAHRALVRDGALAGRVITSFQAQFRSL
jgi:hypothetical protein